MQRAWVHEDLTLSRFRRLSSDLAVDRGNRRPKASQVNRTGRSHFRRLDAATVIVAATLLTIMTTLPLVILKLKTHNLPRIVAAQLPELNLALLQPHSKDLFYRRLSTRQKADYSSLVSYVAGIIRSTRNAGADADALANTIVAESSAAKYDPLLVASLILAESSFRKHVSSSVGALGLMQIKPSTGRYVSSLYGVKWNGPGSLKDPQYNIQLGIAYLKYLEGLFGGNMTHTLVAYNWGPGNMLQALRHGQHRIPRGCLAYSRKILKNHGSWRADLGSKKIRVVGAQTFSS